MGISLSTGAASEPVPRRLPRNLFCSSAATPRRRCASLRRRPACVHNRANPRHTDLRRSAAAAPAPRPEPFARLLRAFVSRRRISTPKRVSVSSKSLASRVSPLPCETLSASCHSERRTYACCDAASRSEAGVPRRSCSSRDTASDADAATDDDDVDADIDADARTHHPLDSLLSNTRAVDAPIRGRL